MSRSDTANDNRLRCEWIEPLRENALLNFKILTDGLLVRESERDRDIVNLRYGIDAASGLSLNEIGTRHDISRERVRQIIYKYIGLLGNTIYASISSVEIEEEPRLSIVDFLGRLAGPQFVHFEACMDALCKPYQNILTQNNLAPYIVLAIDLLPHANLSLDERNFVLFKSMTQIRFMEFWRHFRKQVKTIALPLSFSDAIRVIADNSPDIPPITAETIGAILKTLIQQEMYIEEGNDGQVMTRFTELTTIGLQAERVLHEAGHPLHYDAIRSEILRRIKASGNGNLPQPDFNTGLFGLNPNVESKDKSGFWRLTYWKNF